MTDDSEPVPEPVPAVLLCGGRGTRLSGGDAPPAVRDAEKPMLPIAGKPMVARVLDALLAAERVGVVHAVTSPHTPATAGFLEKRATAARSDEDGSRPVRVTEGSGEGYVADLDAAISRVGTPAVTVAADLPLLAPADVDDAVAHAAGDSLAVCVPASLKRSLGISADTTFRASDAGSGGGGVEDAEKDDRELAPTGLNVVGEGADRLRVREGAAGRRLAMNVNRPRDVAVADRLISEGE